MSTVNDDKHRVILGELKVTDNLSTTPSFFDEPFNIKTFKKKFSVVVVRYENTNEMEFDLIGIPPAFANMFRRLMLSDVPAMAIDKVCINNNTSIIQDDVLAHRIGLIPLKADPRLFEQKVDDSATDSQGTCTLEYELKVKCTYNKDANKKDASRAEDIYKNSNVYSKQIKWTPIGDQKERLKDFDVGPVHPDILIAKLRPGHELDLKLVAVKSFGRDHAKFSPVATAFYRLLPDIKIVKPVEDEAAYRLQKCFAPGVISVKQENGKKFAVVTNSRYDTSSRNVYRYDDLKDSVVMTKIQDHFIFTVESVGALPPDVIFTESVTIMKNKCLALLEELNS